MLHTLRVRNIALVEDITVEFEPGLNVLTGETGAGKSILIGALALLLGERADRTLIRSGADQCLAEALFTLADSEAVDAVLEDHGLPPTEGGELLLRRVLTTAGATRSFVNDGPVTLQVLRRIGEALVDMHGPYDHQSLLQPAAQMDLLDAFGHLWDDRGAYETLYADRTRLLDERAQLAGQDAATVAQRLDLLTYQIKEIEEVAPVEGEDETLAQEQVQVANAARILELSAGIRQALTEDEESAFSGLAAAQKLLNELAALVPAAAGWREEARGAAVQVQELAATLERFASGIEADPQRLGWIENRMAQYYKLRKKYGGSVRAALDFLEKARDDLKGLESRGVRLAELDERIAELDRKLQASGQKLGKARRAAAGKLAAAVTSELRDLGFPHGSFEVGLTAGEPCPSGLDAIEFGFAPNLGEPLRPLRAIASSGEISRVMLATKAVLANHDRIPVLVFDEIDANVGGEMGRAIGSKLAAVAKHHQVLCITHLPQVAVCGKTHFAVSKEVSGGRTRTRIDPLSRDRRVEEVARMLGGRDLTSVTLKHARELIEQGNKASA
jgi:DNA repair protein RecN (Recombination protein N)